MFEVWSFGECLGAYKTKEAADNKLAEYLEYHRWYKHLYGDGFFTYDDYKRNCYVLEVEPLT